MMRTYAAILVVIASVGIGGQVSAQAQCEELTRLRSRAAEASKRTVGVPTLARCESYTQLSMAWDAVTQYANDHRESCDVSATSLDWFDKNHRDAVTARDNVCAGRPARPYPADIIQR
jgi:hypothetical protein